LVDRVHGGAGVIADVGGLDPADAGGEALYHSLVSTPVPSTLRVPVPPTPEAQLSRAITIPWGALLRTPIAA